MNHREWFPQFNRLAHFCAQLLSRLPEPDSTAILFPLINFYCAALMYFRKFPRQIDVCTVEFSPASKRSR
jgi:hypothetical protein